MSDKKGYSTPGLFGDINHYDSSGKKIGESRPGLFGGYTNYDANGKKVGHSDPGLFGGYNYSDSQGCYVATCVYGSYDCPEVWTLRRFRDFTLSKSFFCRAFIKCYYAISPKIVKRFGNNKSFRKFWLSRLNKLVLKLQSKGYENSPYEDKKYE